MFISTKAGIGALKYWANYTNKLRGAATFGEIIVNLKLKAFLSSILFSTVLSTETVNST